MDFININTESQSGHLSVRGQAGTEPRCPGGRSSNLHGVNSSATSSEGREGSQGSPVNLCPGKAMYLWFLLPWFLPRRGYKLIVNRNWMWCYLGIEWDHFSICSLFPPEDKGCLGGGPMGASCQKARVLSFLVTDMGWKPERGQDHSWPRST